MALRVVIADDHALVRDGIVSLLGRTADIDVVATANDLPGLLAPTRVRDARSSSLAR